MEIKETSLRTQAGSVILEDVEYYKYIFKKTEKMACAVFYIVRSDTSVRHNDTVVLDLESAAQALQDVSLESLKSTIHTQEERMTELLHVLIKFESKLRIANAARILSTELLDVFLHEIDSVQRSLKKYVEVMVANPLEESNQGYEPIRERKFVRTQKVGGVATTQENLIPRIGGSRRERVLNVLRDKGEATIKDIVEVVTDCSEKTIQRELISLIKDNIIHREGERRWSKYKLV